MLSISSAADTLPQLDRGHVPPRRRAGDDRLGSGLAGRKPIPRNTSPRTSTRRRWSGPRPGPHPTRSSDAAAPARWCETRRCRRWVVRAARHARRARRRTHRPRRWPTPRPAGPSSCRPVPATTAEPAPQRTAIAMSTLCSTGVVACVVRSISAAPLPETSRAMSMPAERTPAPAGHCSEADPAAARCRR